MTRRITSPALSPTSPALSLFRIVTVLFRIVTVATLAAVLGAVSGCSPSPAPREARSPSPLATSPSGPTPDVFTFADGAELTADSDISWGDGLFADGGWKAVPSEHPGRWTYVNASGACTAAFRGGVLGEAEGMDDKEATDAVLEHQAGEDWLGQELLADGIFLPHERSDRAVAQRQFSYTVNGHGYFMAARAFVHADYAAWVIITCEGEPVGPVAQEVLSKNVIAIDG